LIVAIDSDEKVAQMKGKDRPIFSQEDRSKVLQAIRYIDVVHIFNSKEELEDLIKTINPDIMVVGSDWKGKEVVGEQYAKTVRFFDRVGEYSTTRTLQGLTYR
jgi:D-beta-D-heptose 7-phosphate kinase/D-beta-D-heptose 1-phosphate adenosyltransferase